MLYVKLWISKYMNFLQQDQKMLTRWAELGKEQKTNDLSYSLKFFKDTAPRN